MPAPPAGAGTPPQWGVEAYVEGTFAGAGVRAAISHESVVFAFPSTGDAVRHYTDDFGPFVMLRGALEPQGRWSEFTSAFTALVERFDEGGSGDTRVRADYLLIEARR